MTDDGRPDSTMWGNRWFWVALAVMLAGWAAAVVWLVVQW